MPQYTLYGSPTSGSTYWMNVGTTSNVVLYPQLTTAATTNYQLTYDPTWQNWVNSNAITTMQPTYADQIWGRWASSTPITYDPAVLRHDNERYEAERRQRREEAQAARTRARMLLGEFLDDGQKAELERHGRFHITGSKGRRYCIRATGQQGNVDLLDDKGGVQATLCAHPRGYLPDGDAWLMQMVEIRHDEDNFLRVANVHRGRLPVGVR